MDSNHHTVLLFGDVTDRWVSSIDYVYSQAATKPWLQSFLDSLFSAIRSGTRAMDRAMQDSLRNCSSFQELPAKYRYTGDEFGMAHAMLIYVIRAVDLLKAIDREPQLLDPNRPRPEVIGIPGGLSSAAVVPTSTNLKSLYDACLEAGRVWARLCNLILVRLRAMEECPGTWGWAVLGIPAKELGKTLEQFQNVMGVPSPKRAKVGVNEDRWSTVIGPPSSLELVLNECPTQKNLPKNELDIHALQHTLSISEADIDYIVGNSLLLDTPLPLGYKICGLDEDRHDAAYSGWSHLLRASVSQTLSRPLNIVQAPPTPESRYGIAVIGMAGKGPGSDDLEGFWNVILKGVDLHQEVPPDRFDVKEYYCPKHPPAGPGKCTMTCRHGCFMNNPGHFDSKFFHISPKEAMLMDPAHRLFLMNAYEALEMAGYSDGQTRWTDPTKIATFFGQCNDEWHVVGHRKLGDKFTYPSCLHELNGKGHRYGRSRGRQRIIHSHSFTSLSRSGVLSDSGNCKTYRDDADGYCRADFSGAVVLKRLDDVITSITTSDAAAQERLFHKVLRKACVTPEDISYVEINGTGTQVGDKAEMGAVSSVFSKRRDGELLPVGAIKANLGHSGAAAGMSSLLKSIFMFQKGTIPPQAGMPHTLNPNFPPLTQRGWSKIVRWNWNAPCLVGRLGLYILELIFLSRLLIDS
ncbi:putative PKS-like enzyme [Aspergillus flavus]|uniref:PKS-like enzyme n=1 Tax=Aspergillus flavus (strain ATCC 200026 / FGSC A1120 / IAM 13836 / NRRL 3357 / JCM 12722 / SRRC 167) TaxID=332952 RepID=A0A7U2QUR6_ASPFN|nr:putative PKS-like enzyme [Aspergillus flavus]